MLECTYDKRGEMMMYHISVSSQVYDLLKQRAQQSQTSPDRLAEQVLRLHLSADQENWHQEFELLLAKVRARTFHFNSDEIEADIIAAGEEVKEIRRARRPA
jgi:hypothetical protein